VNHIVAQMLSLGMLTYVLVHRSLIHHQSES
jgi:hypothetical protein